MTALDREEHGAWGVISQILIVIVLFIGVLSPKLAWSQTTEPLSIHGYGSWIFGQTDNDNRYLSGNESGNYDNVHFALNVSARLDEHVQIYAQPAFSRNFERSETCLDYAFAELFFNEGLTFRIGKIKLPFMIYNEIYDVGTLRPFLALPAGIYTQMSAKAYTGVGLSGTLFSGDIWEWSYDLYGGRGELLPQRIAVVPTSDETGEPIFEQAQYLDLVVTGQDLYGLKICLDKPRHGLGFGLSYYSADVTYRIKDASLLGLFDETLDIHIGRHHIGGIFTEFSSDVWTVRSEYVLEQGQDEEGEKYCTGSGYAELARIFKNRYQLAVRYEQIQLHNEPSDQFNRHRELALGLNYWFSPELVLKCSYHLVDGNVLAYPDTAVDAVYNAFNDCFHERTQLFMFGAQFSF
ncbi:hypothetical protein JXQ70_17615 [bacterium]|nr:hypothetical protein [bacterium]